MTSLNTDLFPFPHWLDGKMMSGSAIDWSDTCRRCTNLICKTPRGAEIHLCSYGYNYIFVNDRMTVAGVLLREVSSIMQARKKRMKSERSSVVSKAMVDSSINAVRTIETTDRGKIGAQKNTVIDEYVAKEQFKSDFLTPLREDIQKGLSFVHDYKQINTQIRQNINVLIESRYAGGDIEDKLEKAAREEKAIYMASKMLDEKLNVAKFLMHPEWLDMRSECCNSRFHGIVIKYRRIYSPKFEGKDLDIRMIGSSFNEIWANPQALSVIPHTFIDNAAKYSPKHGKVEIITEDMDEGIMFKVSSYGPRILPEEESKIFYPFFRGKAAKKEEEEGAGYGLYLSQMIANRHFGTEITVEQDSRQTSRKGHWTTFSVTFPFDAIIR